MKSQLVIHKMKNQLKIGHRKIVNKKYLIKKDE